MRPPRSEKAGAALLLVGTKLTIFASGSGTNCRITFGACFRSSELASRPYLNPGTAARLLETNRITGQFVHQVNVLLTLELIQMTLIRPKPRKQEAVVSQRRRGWLMERVEGSGARMFRPHHGRRASAAPRSSGTSSLHPRGTRRTSSRRRSSPSPPRRCSPSVSWLWTTARPIAPRRSSSSMRAERPWIELVRRPHRQERHFAGKVQAFNAGSSASAARLPVVVNLDADVSLEPRSFRVPAGEICGGSETRRCRHGLHPAELRFGDRQFRRRGLRRGPATVLPVTCFRRHRRLPAQPPWRHRLDRRHDRADERLDDAEFQRPALSSSSLDGDGGEKHRAGGVRLWREGLFHGGSPFWELLRSAYRMRKSPLGGWRSWRLYVGGIPSRRTASHPRAHRCSTGGNRLRSSSAFCVHRTVGAGREVPIRHGDENGSMVTKVGDTDSRCDFRPVWRTAKPREEPFDCLADPAARSSRKCRLRNPGVDLFSFAQDVADPVPRTPFTSNGTNSRLCL